MPEFEVTIRYRLEWTGLKRVKAKNDKAAGEIVEKQFEKIGDYAAFEKYVEEDSTPECDVEELEVEDVSEV